MTKHTLAVQDHVVTMSSLDIAEMVGSRPSDVKRSIERLAKAGVIQLPPLAKVENKQSVSPNKYTSAYIFEGEQGKRDSIIVVAQLSPEFTARLVDRWQELEARLSKPAFDAMAALNDAEFLRGTLLSYSEKVIALEHRVDEMKPDVEALERIAKADGSMCITAAAKHLQVQPKFLFKLLSERHWIYRRAGGKAWLGYQDKIQSGYLEHKVTTVNRSDGSEKIVEQVLITAKGITKISRLLGVSAAA
ncbi:DNA-binding protein [Salmonella enterica subsp. enterica serovar Richmond]|uniref:DNA-binding protein n=1 Tax=Salmonella enterica TaxID=28901 RepID=A0A747XZT9_SALER|nr:DNA-binding protein [Salmonella enterica]EBR0169495.1 DNA-binding protein [Salmonella enterica subsp. enterica serovar Mikawasima]EBS2855425.1 DNA-binding protein [Salmonella enterica subsp. enterica serovar Richmond]EBV2471160.1 DNA-binding protein [Salmonella enterica subsp. enterica serovar Potsdam]EBX4347669.1 DNA-binding protein [Salmonella enterica subsp. enterica serovar Halle]EDT6673003.1 DNA-binding protein [Salmonella enterica subsp. enterica]HDP0196152.1 phage antirepressor KilA